MVFKIITMILAGLTPITCLAEFRDPTQPAYPLATTGINAAGGNELVLSAILISSQSRRATINGVSAKPGQTIAIEQASRLNPEQPALANTAADSDKKDQLFNKAMKPELNLSDAGTNRPTQGKIIDPLLATASEGNNPTNSSTIKIISIRKNSVTIEQNGELKILQLVQRPYKTQSIPKYTLK